ncbi:G2/M phase-specific E3 ubiquitin-protein ligase-like [Melanotaenia boesemani]|nr:G2/M phase-specific E3 ubiquitin-protein ligase-like [Melanotaenia boesemani]
MPSSGYSVRYLRLESGLNKALAYIVPLQRKLVDIEECKPNDLDTVLEKCKSCNQDFPLYKLENHFNECERSYIDLTKDDEKETEDEIETEEVAEETSGEESEDFTLQAALEESLLTQPHHFPEPATEEQATSESNGKHIANVLTALEKAIDYCDGSPASYISVCRSHIWMGARLALSRKTFHPHWRINVKFMDDVGVAEGAVDTGGPKREFFTLVLDYLHGSGLFVGPESSKLLTFSSSAMEKDDYFYAGMMIAMSLVHGGPAPRFFSRTLFHAITGSPEKTTVTIDEVPDLKLKENLQRVLSGEVPEDLEDIIDMAGSRCIMATPENAQQMALDTAHWYIFGRTRSAFERFKDGLKTLGVYSAMLENKESFLHVMCHQDNPITAEQIKEAFKPVLNSPGSNKRSTENLILCLWENFIFEAEDEDSDVSLEKILFFSTGLKSFPPLDLRPSPTLCFLHDAEDSGKLSSYPKANTCTNQLYLPTVHKTYHEFKNHMVFGICASAGFGLP